MKKGKTTSFNTSHQLPTDSNAIKKHLCLITLTQIYKEQQFKCTKLGILYWIAGIGERMPYLELKCPSCLLTLSHYWIKMSIELKIHWTNMSRNMLNQQFSIAINNRKRLLNHLLLVNISTHPNLFKFQIAPFFTVKSSYINSSNHFFLT